MNLAAVAFFASCIGCYALPFLCAKILRSRELDWRRVILGAIGSLAAAAAWLWIWPLSYCSDPNCLATDGYLWRIARRLPEIHGSSVLFFVLAAAGIGQLCLACNRQGFRSPILWIFIAFAIVSVRNATIYEKYFDFFALFICLVVNLEPEDSRRMPGRALLVAYCVGFVAYALVPYVAAAR